MNFRVIVLLAFLDVLFLIQNCIKKYVNTSNVNYDSRQSLLQPKSKIYGINRVEFVENTIHQFNAYNNITPALSGDYMGIHLRLSYSFTSLNNFFKPLKNHYKLF